MAVSHRDVCKDGDGCCPTCGHYSYAADDGRCLYCHPSGGIGKGVKVAPVSLPRRPLPFKPARNAKQAVQQRAYFVARGTREPEELAAAIDRYHP